MRPAARSVLALATTCLSGPAVAQHIYRTDDGHPNGLVSTSFPELLLLNYYFVEPPHDEISRLVISNPAVTVASGEVLIWDDPDDDGEPRTPN